MTIRRNALNSTSRNFMPLGHALLVHRLLQPVCADMQATESTKMVTKNPKRPVGYNSTALCLTTRPFHRYRVRLLLSYTED
jgi:hypothetical protein